MAHKIATTTQNFIKSLLSSGGISSKRFWGSVVTGMLCYSYIVCVHDHAEMPDATYAFLTYAAVLLGIETVFNKKV